MNLNDELLKPAVHDYYDALKEDKKYVTPIGRDYSKFTIDSKGLLRLCGSPDIDLMNSSTHKSLALSTIASKHGINIVRNELDFVDYSREKLSAKTTKVLKTVRDELGAIDKDHLEELAKLASDGLGEILDTLGIPLQVQPSVKLSITELQGLDKTMQTMWVELINDIAKLSELDKHIVYEKL